MDYIGNKCQVCDEAFCVGDDVVVCPECGTPHHRDCYINLGHCINEEKHVLGFDYLEDLNSQKKEVTDNNNNDETLIECKKCGAKNSGSASFCSKCGESFTQNTSTQNNNKTEEEQPSSPFSAVPGSPNILILDPLAGIKPETELGDGVTVADTAKYVKQNTPYFITVFNGIKKYSRSRFNFCAAFFGGGYLLYRKMYKIGTIITIIQALMMIASSYLTFFIETDPVFSQIITLYQEQDMNAVISKLSTLSSLESAVFMIYPLLTFLSIAISITIGFVANRIYFNHCKKEIIKIKKSVEKPEDINSVMKTKGGVNIGLGVSLWVSYIILNYLPRFFY